MVSASPEARTSPGAPEPDSAVAEAGQRVKRRSGRLGIAVPVALLVIVFGSCFLVPLVLPIPDPISGSLLDSELPPFSPGHLLGTDSVGYDVFSRLLYGGRISLLIAVAVNLIGLAVGGSLGAFAGYRGGLLDAIIMRILDVLIAFPSLVLTLAIAESLGPSVSHTIFALSFFSVPAFARTARAATLRLREQTFVSAARLCGTKTSRIVFRHLAPQRAPAVGHLRAAGYGHHHRRRGCAQFPATRYSATEPQLGEHDLPGPAGHLDGAAARGVPQCVPVRRHPRVQPAGRRDTRPLERDLTSPLSAKRENNE